MFSSKSYYIFHHFYIYLSIYECPYKLYSPHELTDEVYNDGKLQVGRLRLGLRLQTQGVVGLLCPAVHQTIPSSVVQIIISQNKYNIEQQTIPSSVVQVISWNKYSIEQQTIPGSVVQIMSQNNYSIEQQSKNRGQYRQYKQSRVFLSRQ